MKKIILAGFLAISTMGWSQAKNGKILELMEVMGTKQNLHNVLNTMVAQYKTSYPDIPSEFWKKAISEENVNDLFNKMIPLYSKYYTEKEINDLIVFYKTPTGKKMVETMPLVMNESMKIGQKWGMEIGSKIQAEVDAQMVTTEEVSYSPPPPPAPANPKRK
jgi:hypothetical protein